MWCVTSQTETVVCILFSVVKAVDNKHDNKTEMLCHLHTADSAVCDQIGESKQACPPVFYWPGVARVREHYGSLTS